jgi:hypothetical protein
MTKSDIKLFKFNIKKILRHILGMKNYTKLIFRFIHGYSLNLENPRSLSQKINWIKLNCNLESLAPFVDKYDVRDFVKKRVGEKYLIPLIGIYDRFDQIDFHSLPKSFAMKATHGSNWNILIKDKDQIDWNATRKQMNKWLKLNYYNINLEAVYKNLKGRIIIEELLQDSSGDLKDFKFYCYNGTPRGAHVDFHRYGNHQYRVYDAQWNEFIKENFKEKPPPIIPKPGKFEELLDVCYKLSRGFSFVRVDLYYTDERIYFGEMTFTPGDGLEVFDPVKSDFYLGEAFDVKNYATYPGN